VRIAEENRYWHEHLPDRLCLSKNLQYVIEFII